MQVIVRKTPGLVAVAGWLVVSVLLAALSGCAAWRAASEPVATTWDRLAEPSAPADKSLIVFLPGAFDDPQDIVDQGFVRQVRARGLAADVVVADLHLGYYRSRAFDTRLRVDIVEPARAAGYRQVWFAGISLGGFGSLMFARLNAGAVDGIIAIAPYVARSSVLAEVIAAGGLARWNEPVVEGDFERDLLRWLKGYGATGEGEGRPPLYVGYGTEDGYAEFASAIGSLLPPGHLRSAPGRHDWPPWRQLWGELLDAAPLPRLAAPGR